MCAARLGGGRAHGTRRYHRRDHWSGANTLSRTQQPLTDKEPAVTGTAIDGVVTAYAITPN